MYKKKIIFISHESSLSGAPILLLNLILLLKKEDKWDIKLVIKRGNDLDKEFIKTGIPILILKTFSYQKNKNLPGKMIDYLGYRWRFTRMIFMLKNANAIISNTITNGRLLKRIFKDNKRLITYVHELEDVIKTYDKHKDSSYSLKYSAFFFSPCAAVSQNLIRNHNLDPQKILPLDYYISPPILSLFKTKKQFKLDFFEQYAISASEKFCVVGMGAAVLRKGIDFFVEICKYVLSRDDGFHFVWIGGFLEKDLEEKINKQIQTLGICDHITITGFISPNKYNLLPFDVLALTSREDPYPLVVLEAAALGIPTISFDDNGGASEFIGHEAGILIKNRSIESFAQAIIKLKNSLQLLSNMSYAAKAKVLEKHANPDTIIQQLDTALNTIQAL